MRSCRLLHYCFCPTFAADTPIDSPRPLTVPSNNDTLLGIGWHLPPPLSCGAMDQQESMLHLSARAIARNLIVSLYAVHLFCRDEALVFRNLIDSLHVLSAFVPNSLDYSLEETLVVQPPDAGKQKHGATTTRLWRPEGGVHQVFKFNLFFHPASRTKRYHTEAQWS